MSRALARLRPLVFHAAFFAVTGLMMLFGIWLLAGPRSWAMQGLKLHARVSLWLLRIICGISMEVRGSENLPDGPALIVAKHQSAWDT
ncbi:MAG: hypothetical protein KDD77_19315, partial [Caldilineaceae bacterium]|nr:hypothetical protein [Caldilineaceae bacterium]